MRTFALFGAKNFRFFEINGVSARTRGGRVEPVRTFYGEGGGEVASADKRGGGTIFRDFVRTSFMDGPLCSCRKVVS